MSEYLKVPDNLIVPPGKNLVQAADEAAAAADEIPTWTPTPPPAKPAVVEELRRKAGEVDQEILAAQSKKLQLEAEATDLEHKIYTAKEKVRMFEIKLSKLEAQDHLKAGVDARAAIKAGIENCDQAGAALIFDRAWIVMDRASEFHKIHGESLKETKAELILARKTLATLMESK